MKEANLVCKQLGFSRGVRSTTQGLVHGPVDKSRKITENVECQGSENSIQKCNIRCVHFEGILCSILVLTSLPYVFKQVQNQIQSM